MDTGQRREQSKEDPRRDHMADVGLDRELAASRLVKSFAVRVVLLLPTDDDDCSAV